MIIPMWVDINKDKELINFLDKQTNKSATMRNIIYNYIRGINYKVDTNNINTLNLKEELDNDFINSLNDFESD